MTRQQRTHQLLVQRCGEEQRGFEASELAPLLGAARHNVSADLNELWREGRVVKVAGRPVLFWDREVYQRLHGNASPAAPAAPPDDPLTQMIGAQDSLRSQVEQSKAAMLYPPSGLHTLLIGPTGVGKSYMAELLHAFGIHAGRLRKEAPFVTLNCADYANNPQLLMAHLFGTLKGAYTGADKEQAGLVDHANGGILFLDEVHRLPAEGQEMLFRLIDKGLYRRLGETGPERQARVMLIAATTERVDSALLRTFTRRIPMVIALPALAERTARERFRFVRRFLRAEAAKIGADLTVPLDTLRMLLEYECLGNIGQLRTDVQLACARLFLNYLTNLREPIELLPAHLPEHIHRTLPPTRQRQPEVAELLLSLGGPLLISKHAARQATPEAEAEPARGPISFYSLLEREMQELQRLGKGPAEAGQMVQRNIEVHFRDFFEQVRHRHRAQRLELANLVGDGLLRAVEKAVLWAEGRLGRALPERILYALALHVHSSLERAAKGGLNYLTGLTDDGTPEALTAAGMMELLSRELGRPLPASDLTFLTMLLRPETDEELPRDPVGVLVLAHGQVASAMVDVAHTLTGVTLARSIDMPMDVNPGVIQDQLLQMAGQGLFPGGLLLLVDMGSLERMGQEVGERTGVPVRTISMVSTPVVVEAVHQASMPGATLDQVYQATLTTRSLLLGRDGSTGLPQVILTFCFTGVGSAHTLAKIVREALGEQVRRVEIIPASKGPGSGWTRLVSTLLQSHRLLAVVGPVHPHIPGVPYVSTEAVVVGSGTRFLRRLVAEGTTADRSKLPELEAGGTESLLAQMAVSLGEHLIATNPAATVPVIAKCLTAVEQYLGRPLDEALRVGLTMHLVCLLDRKVRDRLQAEAPAALPPIAHRGRYAWLPDALREMTAMFHVPLSGEELERLDEIIGGSVSV